MSQAVGMEHPGDRVQLLRTERGWTQRELAAKAKVSPATVSMLEGRERSGSRKTLIKLAEALGSSLEYLMVGTMAAPAGTVSSGGLAIPLEGMVLANGEVQSERLSQLIGTGLFRASKDAFSYPVRIEIAGAKEDWWVLTAETSYDRTPIRKGDHLVIAPGVTPREGDWVLATSDTDEYHELFAADAHEPVAVLRQWRLIDGDPWLWPLSKADHPDQLESYWRIVGVVVSHRRRPDAWG